MPRIAYIGDFDWDFPDPQDYDYFFGGNTALNFRLLLPERLAPHRKPRLLQEGECVAFFADSEDVADKLGRLPPTKRAGIVSCGIVSEERTIFLPSRFREMARFLAKQEWANGKACACEARYKIEDPLVVSYIVAIDTDNKEGFVEFPTKFIKSLAAKVERWAKLAGLNELTVPIRNLNAYMKSTYVCGFESSRDCETLERWLIKVEKNSGQRLGYFLPPKAKGERVDIFTDGSVSAVLESIDKFKKELGRSLQL